MNFKTVGSLASLAIRDLGSLGFYSSLMLEACFRTLQCFGLSLLLHLCPFFLPSALFSSSSLMCLQHSPISLSFSVSVSLCLYLYHCLSMFICLSVSVCLCLCLSVSVCLSLVLSLSLFLSLSLSLPPPLPPSICISLSDSDVIRMLCFQCLIF